ncbi:MAG: polysaccharide deacetylase family protein [Myxococcota bacterium]
MLGDLRARLLDWVSDVLYAGGFTDLRRRQAGKLAIVTFHRVLPEELRRRYPHPGLAVTPQELAWCLAFLGRHFACAPLQEAHRRWSTGEALDRPLLAVTFDDGCLDNVEHARPVLDRADVRATFFVPVAFVADGTPLWHDALGFALERAVAERGREVRRLLRRFGLPPPVASDAGALSWAAQALVPARRQELVAALRHLAGSGDPPPWAGPMRWDHVRRLHREGHEVGSHSVTHGLLPQYDSTAKNHELRASRRILEDEIGHRVTSLAYPNGAVDDATEQAARSAGYERAVTTRWGANAPGANPMRLRRFDMDVRRMHRRAGGELSEARLAWRLSGLHPGLRA